MSVDMPNTWMTVEQAYPLLRLYFRSVKTLQHHLGRRERNGLAAADAVRLSPLRRLIVNPERVAQWVIGQRSHLAT